LIVPGGAAVVSADHDESAAVVSAARARNLRILTVGHEGEGIRLKQVTIEGQAQRIALDCQGKHYNVHLPLVGAFQIENALVAAGIVLMTGGAADATFAALENLQGAKGRIELVGSVRNASVFIDYAHKPDALEKALAALRPYAKRELIVA